MFQNDGILNEMHTGIKSAGVFVLHNDDYKNKMYTGKKWRAVCVSK